MVRPERFELPTSWFVARRSIQLSYGRKKTTINKAWCVENLFKSGFPSTDRINTTYRLGGEGGMGSALRASSLQDRRRCADVSLPLFNTTITSDRNAPFPPLCSSSPLAEREGFEPSMGF